MAIQVMYNISWFECLEALDGERPGQFGILAREASCRL